MGEFTHGEILARLQIVERFNELERDDVELEPGAIFELVSPKGAFPGKIESLGKDDTQTTQDDASGLSDEAHAENPSNEECAEKVIPLLVAHVLQQQDDVMHTLTYEEVAERLGRRNKHGAPYPRGLGKILGRAMDIIDAATREQFDDVPYLTTIVVSKTGKDKGLPGVGVRGRWKDYDKLDTAEKAAKVLDEHLRILRFGPNWSEVLTALNMAPVPSVPTLPDKGRVWGKGGESEAHKALKAYVKSHPELFGATSSCEALEEYALRSGDSIDVFFKSSEAWIGVEVKSRVSNGNDLDLQRGLFQVVKYKAVLRAQALADALAEIPIIKVLLVLEGELPVSLKPVAKALQVEVREKISPQDPRSSLAA